MSGSLPRENCRVCNEIIDPEMFFLDYSEGSKLCKECYYKFSCKTCSKNGIPYILCECQMHLCYDCAWKHNYEAKGQHNFVSCVFTELPGKQKMLEIDREIGEFFRKSRNFNGDKDLIKLRQIIEEYRSGPRKNYADEQMLSIKYLESLILFLEENSPNQLKASYVVELSKLLFSSGFPTKGRFWLEKIREHQGIDIDKWILGLNYLDVDFFNENKRLLPIVKEFIYNKKRSDNDPKRLDFFIDEILKFSGPYESINLQICIQNNNVFYLLDKVRVTKLEDQNVEVLQKLSHFLQAFHQNFVVAAEVCEIKSDFYREVSMDFNKALEAIEESLVILYRNMLGNSECVVGKLMKLSEIFLCLNSQKFCNSITEGIRLACQLQLDHELVKGCKLLKKYYITKSDLEAAKVVNGQMKQLLKKKEKK